MTASGLNQGSLPSGLSLCAHAHASSCGGTGGVCARTHAQTSASGAAGHHAQAGAGLCPTALCATCTDSAALRWHTQTHLEQAIRPLGPLARAPVVAGAVGGWRGRRRIGAAAAGHCARCLVPQSVLLCAAVMLAPALNCAHNNWGDAPTSDGQTAGRRRARHRARACAFQCFNGQHKACPQIKCIAGSVRLCWHGFVRVPSTPARRACYIGRSHNSLSPAREHSPQPHPPRTVCHPRTHHRPQPGRDAEPQVHTPLQCSAAVAAGRLRALLWRLPVQPAHEERAAGSGAAAGADAPRACNPPAVSLLAGRSRTRQAPDQATASC